ncbi:TLR adapter interacting with SLC15A4 on the lysosome-like [Erethizon dorsatum]
MLGEAFLIELLYKEQEYTKVFKPLTCKKTSNDEKETWKNKLLDIEDNLLAPNKTESKKKVMKESITGQSNITNQVKSVDELSVVKCKTVHLPGNVSLALSVPKREQYDKKQLDLYRSSSYTSICQNYPDLQIGGDHVRNIYDSGCFVEHTHDDDPLLFSVDIPLGHSPTIIEPLQKTSTSKSLNGDEFQERTMLFYKQPLSNSGLNSYMEKKVSELYKQFLEENLTRCCSITSLMASNLLMNNVNHTSLQISQEQNTEASKAQETLLHSLAIQKLPNISHGNSSEFSTPHLQISNEASRKLVSYLQ